MYAPNPVHRADEIENISQYSAKMHEGCIIQDLLGKKYLTIPYEAGHCCSRYLPQLDGHRVIEAKSDKHFTVILTEKSGKYFRFIIDFAKNYETHSVREVPDVSYDTINFAVNEAGICVLLASPDKLELFKVAHNIQEIDNPPFDSTMPLVSTSEGLFFINGNSIHKIRKK